MEEEMDVFMGGGSELPEGLASKVAMNLEGGEGIARIVEEWTRERRTEVSLHSSPSRGGRKRRPTSVELRSPTRRSPSRKSRPAPSTPPVRFALSTPSDPPSFSSPSNRKTTKDSSGLLPSIVLTSSRPIDPMASSLPPSSLVSEPPHTRPAPIASILYGYHKQQRPLDFQHLPTTRPEVGCIRQLSPESRIEGSHSDATSPFQSPRPLSLLAPLLLSKSPKDNSEAITRGSGEEKRSGSGYCGIFEGSSWIDWQDCTT